jgi:hypothetical protein
LVQGCNNITVDYYHLKSEWDYKTTTFIYNILYKIFVKILEVDCIPEDGNNPTIRQKSATLSMSGHLFQLESPLVFEQASHGRNKGAPTESPEKLASKFDGLFVPSHSRPVEDVSFCPQPRRGLPEVWRLALDVDIPIMVERKES